MTVTEGSQQMSLYQSRGAVDKASGSACPGSETWELIWTCMGSSQERGWEAEWFLLSWL